MRANKAPPTASFVARGIFNSVKIMADKGKIQENQVKRSMGDLEQ